MIYRKCLKCGEFTNNETCEFCGTPIRRENTVLREINESYKKRISLPSKENKFIRFINKCKKHNNIIIRLIAWLIHSVFFLLFTIVSAIAYLIAAIAA